MKPDLAQLRDKSKDLFAGFSSGQRTVLGIAVVGLLLGGWLFTHWAGAPTYAPLYSNLSPSDASSITQDLTSRGVSYKLGADGTSIMVPQDKVYQLRLDMSAKGLPPGGAAGYSLLDKQGITTSEFRQRVDYQRALEGELAKTVSALDPVDAATVHLVIPTEDLFTQDSQHPSASVLVKTQPGKTLSAGQVQAVVNLVSSSVEGMTPDQVTVADTSGRVLSAPGQDGIDAAATDARSQQTSSFENTLAESIQQMLTPVVGAGKAVVRVKADLDFDSKNTTTERFDNNPQTPAPAVSESTSQETYANTAGPNAATGALATTATPLATSGTGNYQKQASERTFAVGKVTEQVKAAPGGVQRLSVAVLVDDKAVSATDAAKVQRLVTAAAGLDTNRGDSVEVSRMAFDTSAQKSAKSELEAAHAAQKQSQLFEMLRTIGAVLIVLVVLFLAWRSTRKAAARYPIALPLEALPVRELEAEIHHEPIDHDGALVAAAMPAASLPAAEGLQLVEGQVGQLIDRQPDEVAQLLRGWLADRRS
jgi:flagellar M-ring protein FliF